MSKLLRFNDRRTLLGHVFAQGTGLFFVPGIIGVFPLTAWAELGVRGDVSKTLGAARGQSSSTIPAESLTSRVLQAALRARDFLLHPPTTAPWLFRCFSAFPLS